MDKTVERFTDMMTFEGRILEMISENSMINVPVNPRIDMSVITADDGDPVFVNVEVIRAGISKTNRRRYNNGIVREINEMIPGVQGFLGHPDPSKHGFEFRDPQCIYVGSMIDTLPDGMERSIAKAYIFKSSPLREWIPKSIAANNPMTVSINGTGDIIRNGDIIDVLHMTDLQSIDWANPGTEGMGTSQAMSIVSELQLETGGIKMENKDIIKGATVAELKAYNSDAVSAIIAGVTLAELQSGNQKLVEEIMEAGKITEMQLQVGGEKKSVKIAELQSVITEFENKITGLNSEIANLKITEFKNAEIAKLVPESFRESISKRVVGTTEAEVTASINAEIAYVREMGGLDNIPGGGGGKDRTGGDVKDAVAKMFGHKKS